MSEKAKILIAEARRLSADERLEIADAILASLAETASEHEAEWLEEAKDRLAAYERGVLGSLDFDAALATHQKQ